MSSYRPLWQAVLDEELVQVAYMSRSLEQLGKNCCKQLRTDGIVAEV